jgi:hypothetical protein
LAIALPNDSEALHTPAKLELKRRANVLITETTRDKRVRELNTDTDLANANTVTTGKTDKFIFRLLSDICQELGALKLGQVAGHDGFPRPR